MFPRKHLDIRRSWRRRGLIRIQNNIFMAESRDVLSCAHRAILRSCAADELWKILIYDNRSQSVIAPVVKVGELRQIGITLMLHIDADRTPVEDVCAVYFVECSQKNLDTILQDIARQKYSSYDLQFITNFTNAGFATFTARCSQLMTSLHLIPTQTFKRVADRCVNFVALDEAKFSLELPDAFSILYNPNAEDTAIVDTIESIVCDLVSLFKVLGARPLIKIPKNEASPARSIGLRLDSELHELQARYGDKFIPLASSRNQRPIFILTDRTFDFYTPLAHCSTYEALLHDCFGIRLNWVQVKNAQYELNKDDEFWRTHQCALYPEVGADTTRLVSEYKAKIEAINAGTATESMRNALEMAPHVLAQKKSLDMHTSIAQALYDELERRSIPDFCNIESEILDQAAASRAINFQSVREILDNGDSHDKQRLVCCLYTLCKDQESKINSLSHVLKTKDSDPPILPALKFLRYQDSLSLRSTQPTYDSLKSDSTGPSAQVLPSANPAMPAGNLPGTANLGELGSKARGWFFQSLKHLINLKQRPKVVYLVEGLSTQGRISEQYDTLDPLGLPGDVRQNNVTQLIVFVIGGASYVEAEAATRWAQMNNKHLLFGSTSFLRPSEFLDQLNKLGDSV